MQEQSNRPKRVPLKRSALFLTLVILVHSIAIVYIAGFIRPAFAQTQVYTVELNIFMNVSEPWVGPGAEGSEPPSIQQFRTIKLTVNEQGEMRSSDGVVQICSDEGDIGFTPVAQQNAMGLIEANQLADADGQVIRFGSYRLSTAGMSYKFGDIGYDGNYTLRDYDEFLAQNYAVAPTLANPVVEKTIVFDSPANYADEFCADNGYTLLNIINSTHEQTIDTAKLNLYGAKAEELELLIIDHEAGSADVNCSSTQDLGASAIAIIVIGIVVSVAILGFIYAPVVERTAHHAIAAMTTIQGLRAEVDIQNHLTEGLTAYQNHVLEMYANGQITWAECCTLLEIGGGQYTTVMQNRSTNIAQILGQYYEDIAIPYGDMATGFKFSWTDIFWWILIAIIAGLGIYAVYAVIKHWSNKRELKVVPGG